MGRRCSICTGCGRCPGVQRVQVLTKRLLPQVVDLQNDGGKRIITADIGTTTIAMQLHGLDGKVEDSYMALNPQWEYGADVISRISAIGNGQSAEQKANAARMQEMVVQVLQIGIRQFESRLSQGESLLMVLAANTTMVYLLMGWAVEELGKAPFTATHLEGTWTELGGIPVYVLPGLSAFVGGDIVAGIYASGMLSSQSPVLLIDLGTNGEIVLGNENKIFTSSTAAGPAFEGGVNRGIWGSDMVKFLAKMRKEGLVDETGLLKDPYFEKGIRIGNVCITQQAIRNVQVAKAAISAGISILVKEYGCELVDISKVILAGGFGYYLNPEDAAQIGLLPSSLVKKTLAGGNTALAGSLYVAGQFLRDGNQRFDLKARTELLIETINLATKEKFEQIFMDAMHL